MKIYTKTGDTGDTGLFGGQRITKSHPRIEAYGCVDELNAHIGFSQALLREAGGMEGAHNPASEKLVQELIQIQHTLFVVGSHLSTPYDPASIPQTLPPFDIQTIVQLELWIDEKQNALPELKEFILPSGGTGGSALHVARTVCRRAERAVVRLASEEPTLPEITHYLNRLSDYLFAAARWANYLNGVSETPWKK